MPPETLRLFIAIELPPEVGTFVASLQKRLQPLDRDHAVRWAAIDHIHLTLKFLGDTDADKCPAIEAGILSALKNRDPFVLRVKGVGCFPDLRKPRIVWAGTEGDLTALHSLRDTVEANIAPLGYPSEARPFSPHLTLGRARKEAKSSALAGLGDSISKLETEASPDWLINTISLIKSELKSSGPVYTRRFEAHFGQ